MGAARWHICPDVLERLFAGDHLGRIVAREATQFDRTRLNTEYVKQFGVEVPS
jgi:hypothetical protein